MDGIVLAHLNINSLRNKLVLVTDQIKGNVDVLAISETKLDDSFPVGQFNPLMPGGNKKVTHLNKPAVSAAGLFKYV